MAGVFILYFVASIAILAKAIPESVILDETFTVIEELPSLKRNEGERKYKLHAFGKEIDLVLYKNNDLLPRDLPVYVYGEDEEGNPTADDWTHRTDSFQALYTDRNTGASVMIEDLEGEIKMTGLIAEDLVIEPVEDIDVAADSTEKRETRTHLRHVIYKIQKPIEETTLADYVHVGEEDNAGKGTEKRQALPEKIYVTVQVVVDYALWKKLARSESEVIRYMKIFYNSVNQVYSTISWPTVSVSIYGITICKSASACNMIEKAKVGSDGLNVKTALSGIQKYAYAERNTLGTDYTAMVVMTDYDMCSPMASGTCERSTSGYASVGSACAPYKYSSTTKTGLAEDHGAFDGVRTVAHEIGHVLGMTHDGYVPPTDTSSGALETQLGMKHDGDGPAAAGAPGARGCRWSDNYIMGETAFVTNQFKWSKCSVEQLRWLAVQPKASCLLKKPSFTKFSLINKLPGKVVDLDNQCKIFYGQSSGVGCRFPGVNSGNDQLCTGLMCTTSARGCSSKTAPAEGSYCGPQRYCRQGKCICDPTAPLPTPPPRDPSCKADEANILINGKSCVNLLSSADGLKSCEGNLVKKYCCVSRAKYCRATPISCDGSPPPTAKPTPPPQIFRPVKTTTEKPYIPPTSGSCGGKPGKPCADTPNMRINGQTCTSLLSSSSGKRTYCDISIITEHCCSTRARVCGGFHWITESCDSSCQDNASMSINRKKCVPFLATATDRERYCDIPITKQHCCATRKKVCVGSGK